MNYARRHNTGHANDTLFLRLGMSVSKQLQPVNPWNIVAKELNCTKQLAWYFGMIALGKLVYRLKQSVKDQRL